MGTSAEQLHLGKLTMSHNDRKASDKQNVLNISRKLTKGKVKSNTTNISAPSSLVCRNIRIEENYSPSQRVKRLKTRKERNQIRGQKISSFYQSHKLSKRGHKTVAQFDCHDCHGGHPFSHSRKEKAVAKPFPTQKPSIITGGRLLSFKGLFSHKVRSVDIERLVKEQRTQNEEENNHGQPAASYSPSQPSPSPLVSRSESGDQDILSLVQEEQRSKSPSKVVSVHTDHVQTNSKDSSTLYSGDEKHTSAQTYCKAAEDIVRLGSPSSKRQSKSVLSSKSKHFKSISTPTQADQYDPNVTPLRSNDEELTNKAKAGVDKQQGVAAPLAAPVRSLHLNKNASQPYFTPEICNSSPSGLDREETAKSDKKKYEKPGDLNESEAVRRLAARLCQAQDFPPLRRRCPLLMECTEVLLQTLQKTHSFRHQDSLSKLHSHLSSEVLDVSHFTEQAHSSPGQQYGDSTPVHFSITRQCEDGLQNGKMEIHADHSSVEDFNLYIERGAAFGTRRRPSWGTYSSQDFLTKLQTPCKDMLGQWSTRVPPQQSLKAKHHFNPQGISLHQTFTGIEIPPSYSHNCGTLEPHFFKSHKHTTQAENENRFKAVTELLDQWRNDPDLDYLFQENMMRPHTSLDSPTELKDWCPLQQSASERPLIGVSSTVPTFFPSEGFRYEPYYRFPHPSNSNTRTERSGVTLYNRSDMKDLGLSPTSHLTSPYFCYLP